MCLERELDPLTVQFKNIVSINVSSEFNKKQSIYSKRNFHRRLTTVLGKFNELYGEQEAKYKAKDEWFRNLSAVDISSDVQGFLALGPKFRLLADLFKN